LQTKLKVSHPSDPLEQEADRVANEIMGISSEGATFQIQKSSNHKLNRKCSACQIRQKMDEDDKEKNLKIRRKFTESKVKEENDTSKNHSSLINSILNKHGKPLDKQTKEFMEPRFGYDFSNVRIHADNEAASRSAESINALAYTVGNNIVFRKGYYNTFSQEGKKLIAHELTHVRQQTDSSLCPSNFISYKRVTEKIIYRQESKPIPKVDHKAEFWNEVKSNMDGHWDRAIDHLTILNETDRSNEIDKINDKNILKDLRLTAMVHFNNENDPMIKYLDERFNKILSPASVPSLEKATSVLSPELESKKRNYEDFVKKGRQKGMNVAADNLEYWLVGEGNPKTLSVNWLRSFDSVKSAETENKDRFENDIKQRAVKMPDGKSEVFGTRWDRVVHASPTTELFYASGISQITSYGRFTLSRIEKTIHVEGKVKHQWRDPYNWNAGQSAYLPGIGNIPDDDALALQKAGIGHDYLLMSDWMQTVTGTVEIGFIYDSTNLNWNGP
jgi:hypothetical protein